MCGGKRSDAKSGMSPFLDGVALSLKERVCIMKLLLDHGLLLGKQVESLAMVPFTNFGLPLFSMP